MSETNENTNDLNEVFNEEMIDSAVITVPIDDTLSNSGEAADAAAVGAALALKADAASIVSISVNGQTADNQGVIIVTGADTKISSTDTTTIKDAIETVDAKTGADIAVDSSSGASSIKEAISSIGDKTAQEIPMDSSEGSQMISAAIASLEQTDVDLENEIETVNAKTGANIPVSGTDSTKISDALASCVKTVNGSTPDADGDVAIDAVPFADNLRSSLSQNITGTFTSRATGSNASVQDGDAWLTTLRGNRIHTGFTPESITMTVLPVEREQGEDTITATINEATFRAYVNTSGTYTIAYTTSWSTSPTLYGITVVGTPKNGDEISVVYVKEVRGTITPSTPETFVATGWNLYNHTNGYARALKYSDNYGYCIEGTYTAVKFSTTVSGEKTTITPVDGYFSISSNGYIWVEGGNNTDTQVYMTWEDWVDTSEHPSWAAYSETVIDISNIMDTYFPYGLLRAGDVRDEINLNAGLAISNVERIEYTAENRAEAEESGRVFEYDENYIYLERSAAVTSTITLDGAFDAYDHGIEFFTGTTTPVYTAMIYGNNLKNKLERDVLTISHQDLTDAQKAQVLANIGATTTMKQVGHLTSGDWNDFTTPQIFFYSDSEASAFGHAPSDSAGFVGVVYFAEGEGNFSERITQVAIGQHMIKYRYYYGSWTSWRTFKPVWVKSVTATTSSNGNITAGLSRSTYVVIGANVNGSDRIAIPTAYNASNWGAHICSTNVGMDSITSTEVTVDFYYMRIEDIGS